MKWDDFFAELKAGKVRQAYLFSGVEDYVKREALDKLRKMLLPAGLEALNESVLEGVNAVGIIEAAETLPMMCDRRLVVVRDWAPLMSGAAKDEDSEAQQMQAWLERPCESCTLVFYMRGECDMRKKSVKTMAKQDILVDFPQLSEPEIRKWIASRLKPMGKKMSVSAMQQLIFTAGKELTRLDGEISKLAAFSGDRSEIDENDVEQIVSPSLEFGAFDMLNHLFDGDTAGAYRTLEMMLERGANRIGILASVTRQLRGMTFMRIAAEGGKSADDAGKALALNPYAAKIMAQKSRRFESKALEALYDAAIDADYAIKSGRARDSAALDMLFIKISMMMDKKLQPTGAAFRQK
jgi:DNA polymerase-3 subunit delta